MAVAAAFILQLSFSLPLSYLDVEVVKLGLQLGQLNGESGHFVIPGL
jgi:hypothetical protein